MSRLRRSRRSLSMRCRAHKTGSDADGVAPPQTPSKCLSPHKMPHRHVSPTKALSVIQSELHAYMRPRLIKKNTGESVWRRPRTLRNACCPRWTSSSFPQRTYQLHSYFCRREGGFGEKDVPKSWAAIFRLVKTLSQQSGSQLGGK